MSNDTSWPMRPFILNIGYALGINEMDGYITLTRYYIKVSVLTVISAVVIVVLNLSSKTVEIIIIFNFALY